MKASSLHITGIVQGVGFRPFVYNLAVEMGLSGWVLNSSDGVYAVVEGDDATVDRFAIDVREKAPAMAVVESVFAEDVEPEGFTGFEIRESRAEPGARTLISPDIATCPDCLAELFTEGDRREQYPFINCTNCGPRFTIIEDVPYDRPMTTMRDFPMCESCAAEYGDPTDRRFHAQPDACFICGPRLYLMPSPAEPTTIAVPDDWRWSPAVETTPRPHRDRVAERERSDEIVGEATRLLREGSILAIKGLGGFHLAVDATNADAVARLRERKHRWGKPLALMVRTPDDARALGLRVNDAEEDLLSGNVRPIVLLERDRPESSAGAPLVARGSAAIAADVADDLHEIGVMLPYTPLHHLLLAEFGRPLVMTSGNLSDEPIATGNAEAIDRLGSIADAFLLNDRDIYSRYDDSVVRILDGAPAFVRRARGYAPFPLSLPFTSDTDILAAGPEQKNTFTLITEDKAFVSQHIGDLENAETLESYQSTLDLYERLFRITPEVVAHDLHPEYLSTKWALGLDLPKVGVQHHHAHVVSVTAEHGVSEPVVGLAFDGTGYGEDGKIWGGEVLLSDWEGYERLAHLRYVPMPGGSGAIKRPARMAMGTLLEYDLAGHPGAAPLLGRLAAGEEANLRTMVERGVNSPMTSSMGRLFDAVAAIAGVADDARYEGEAAILLEAALDPTAEGAYAFELVQTDQGVTIDSAPLLHELLCDVADGIPTGVLSTRFHRAVLDLIVEIGQASAVRAGTRKVALAGGVFMNRFIATQAPRRLSAAGLEPLAHLRLPYNDGAVSYGQAVVAWARRQSV